ncbi:hypothetical protein [Bdellovibrio svalbardensis]|nr:hypothetical protein [Bdellovibrio svalbardensis]
MDLALSGALSVLGFFHNQKKKQFAEDAHRSLRRLAFYMEPSVFTKTGFVWKE